MNQISSDSYSPQDFGGRLGSFTTDIAPDHSKIKMMVKVSQKMRTSAYISKNMRAMDGETFNKLQALLKVRSKWQRLNCSRLIG